MPITSAVLDYDVPKQRYSTGISALDEMFGGQGFFKGSTIMISGSPGTGKTSIASAFSNDICKNGERCIYFALEESPKQIFRNMGSIGINLQPHVEKGLLQVISTRPTLYGLETHLSIMLRQIEEDKPAAVIIDPISNLISVGDEAEVKSMLTRMIDYLKTKQITSLFTSLISTGEASDSNKSPISSWIDTWIMLNQQKRDDDVKTTIRVVKSRGIAHSKRICDFELSDKGISIK